MSSELLSSSSSLVMCLSNALNCRRVSLASLLSVAGVQVRERVRPPTHDTNKQRRTCDSLVEVRPRDRHGGGVVCERVALLVALLDERVTNQRLLIDIESASSIASRKATKHATQSRHLQGRCRGHVRVDIDATRRTNDGERQPERDVTRAEQTNN